MQMQVFYVASRGSRASLVSSRLMFILSLLHKSSNYMGSLIISAHIAATALDKTCYPAFSIQGISVGERILRSVLAARVLRRAWQSPVGALIEGTVASWIVYIAGRAWIISLVGVYGLPIVWMLAGVCVGRLGELWNKVCASILHSYSDIISPVLMGWVAECFCGKVPGTPCSSPPPQTVSPKACSRPPLPRALRQILKPEPSVL
jgi:hypothetical protein